jgi:hypothetical protein
LYKGKRRAKEKCMKHPKILSVPAMVIFALLTLTFAACGGTDKSPAQQLKEISIANGYSAEEVLAAMDAYKRGESPRDAAKAVRAAKESGGSLGENKQAATPAQASVKAAAESDFGVELTEDSKGVVINKYVGSGGTVIIPETIQGLPVREISEAFDGNDALSSVTIPDSVTTIGARAFSGCSRLTSVTIPDSVTKIGWYAFSGSGLTSVIIPDSVRVIEDRAFYDCSSLSSIAIPDSVTEMGMFTFGDCSSLETVTVSKAGRDWGFSAFDNCPKLSLAMQTALRAAGYKDGF